MKLNQLQDNPGATHNSKRIGRGVGSGKGKTAGKGHKGARARSGVSINGFEGGQMPLYRRLPKHGFTNIFRKNYSAINLDRLQEAVSAGKLNADAVIDVAAMVQAGVLSRVKDGVRILGRGSVTSKLNLEVAGASKSAIAAIEKAGGSVKVITTIRSSEQDQES